MPSCLVNIKLPSVTVAPVIPATLPASTVVPLLIVNNKRPAILTDAAVILKPVAPVAPVSPVSPLAPAFVTAIQLAPSNPNNCPAVTPVVSTSVNSFNVEVGVGKELILVATLVSTYCLVAASNGLTGAPASVNGPDIVPPAIASLPVKLVVIVAAKLASLPSAVASSFSVSSVLCAPFTRLLICPVTYVSVA